MRKYITVVYYPTHGNNAEAFHVTNANNVRLQAAFDEHDIFSIKCITIESVEVGSRGFKTIWTESDIKEFIETWKIDF